jgi:hypothetical protein
MSNHVAHLHLINSKKIDSYENFLMDLLRKFFFLEKYCTIKLKIYYTKKIQNDNGKLLLGVV